MSPNMKHARSGDQQHDRRLRVAVAAKDKEEGDSSPPNKANSNDNKSSTNTIVRSSSSQENHPPGKKKPLRRWRRREETSNNTNNNSNRLRSIRDYIPPYLQPYIVPYHGDFCVSTMFHSNLIAQVMAEGFLPIAAQGHYLLPKLHQERCVIDLIDDLHISKSVRKKAKKYSFTINQAMDDVVQGCRQQHGIHCWLYAPLVEAFAQIQHRGACGIPVQVRTTEEQVARTCLVRLYSIEVWEENPPTVGGSDVTEKTTTSTTTQPQQQPRLVAGELGYSVGSIYTSLTGYSSQDSAGSIQLAALGQLLCQRGFTLWDLGMDMEYKRTMGSHLMPREDFVRAVHEVRVRDQNITLPIWDHASAPNCRDIIDNSYHVH